MNVSVDDASGSKIDEEWVMEFHGVDYIINLTATDSLLVIDAESEYSNETWTGEFTSKYIEEITHKAGNFKKFSVFVKMLISSLSKDNDSVYIDLLTFADLEMLKARRGDGTSSSVQSSTTSASKTTNRRYVILTYSGEFDRVHYPLPLLFEDVLDPVKLKRTIKKLRAALKLQPSSQTKSSDSMLHDGDKTLRQVASQLRQDNTELRHRLRQAESRNNRSSQSQTSSTSSSSRGDSAPSQASNMKQIEALKKELYDATLSHEKFRNDSAKEISKWKLRALSGGSTTAQTGGTGTDVCSYSSNKQLTNKI